MRKKVDFKSFAVAGVERQRGQYRYTVKDGADGTPWIAGEPAGTPLTIIGTAGEDLQIGFTLRSGTTYEEAKRVEKWMNDWLVDLMLYWQGDGALEEDWIWIARLFGVWPVTILPQQNINFLL
jgi:hypothetical protein